MRDRLRAYSKFARGQCQAVGDALVPLQRDFYVAFAEKVVKGLALDPDATPVDQRAADKLKDLMARGLAVPNAGMTTDRGAAAAFQMRQPTGPPKTPEESLAGKAPLSPAKPNGSGLHGRRDVEAARPVTAGAAAAARRRTRSCRRA